MLGNVFPQKNYSEKSGETDGELQQAERLTSLDLRPDPQLPSAAPATTSETELTDELAENVDSESQIGMSLGSVARPKPTARLRSDVRRWENLVEVMPFWKIPVFPVNLTITIASLICLYCIVILSFDKLPNTLPLFYSAGNASRVLVDKSLFLAFPIMITALEVITIRLNRVIFNFDRRLSMVISITEIIFNILLVVAVLQLVSLLLV